MRDLDLRSSTLLPCATKVQAPGQQLINGVGHSQLQAEALCMPTHPQPDLHLKFLASLGDVLLALLGPQRRG